MVILNVEKEASVMVDLIVRELVANFGKTKFEAENLVNGIGVYRSLIDNPRGLHESPYQWALIILSESNDIQTLDKYYFV